MAEYVIVGHLREVGGISHPIRGKEAFTNAELRSPTFFHRAVHDALGRRAAGGLLSQAAASASESGSRCRAIVADRCASDHAARAADGDDSLADQLADWRARQFDKSVLRLVSDFAIEHAIWLAVT